MRALGSRLAVWFVLTIVLVATILPNTAIAWMRDHWAWFNLPMLWIEDRHSPVNLIHIVLFLMLGMAARVGLPRFGIWFVASSLLAFGAATEAAQVFVPGRHPRMADIVVDVVAGVAGWLLASLATKGRRSL